jgi:hypothetical protein
LLVAGLLVPSPWTVHNIVSLDRFVPISTGADKAYVGTDLSADGDYQQVKAELVQRYQGRTLGRVGAAERDQPDAAVQHAAISRPAARLGARQDRQAATLRRHPPPPARLPGDAGPPGGADVDQGVGPTMDSTLGRAAQRIAVGLSGLWRWPGGGAAGKVSRDGDRAVHLFRSRLADSASRARGETRF